MKISYQGDRGAFSEVISKRLVRCTDYVPCQTFQHVFANVESDRTELGVIPVENSLTGRINEPTNLLIKSNLKVTGEALLRIVHCLITRDNLALKDINRIYAHPEAFAQCRRFLNRLKCELVS
jgi:prephenate dehydratase